MRYLVVMALVVSACAGAGKPSSQAAPISCEAGDTVLVRSELFFGRNIPGGGEVSDSAWKEFMASYVTPRFPSGLTIIESNGQWRNAAGVVERERGFILQVLIGNAEHRLVREVALEYKRRFRQEAVLRVNGPVCVRFFDG